MARPRKCDEELLLTLIDSYYTEYGGKLKWILLEQYAQKQGVNVREYDFRRSDAARKRIHELNELTALSSSEIVQASYKTPDIDAMIASSDSIETLKSSIHEMDTYWQSVFWQYVDMRDRYAALLSEKDRYNIKTRQLEQENQELKAQLENSDSTCRSLNRENLYLRNMLKKYLYPALAEELFSEKHMLPERKSTFLQPEAMAELIEPVIPLPFDGIQVPQAEAMTRQEKLLESLRRQANGDDDV